MVSWAGNRSGSATRLSAANASTRAYPIGICGFELDAADKDPGWARLLYQRTAATYCNVRPEGPGAVAVLISGPAMSAYMARTGNFPDGSQTALHLKDMGILMVTTYEEGRPVYQVFSEDGKDITAAEGPLAATTCSACHADADACVNGQCGMLE